MTMAMNFVCQFFLRFMINPKKMKGGEKRYFLQRDHSLFH